MAPADPDEMRGIQEPNPASDLCRRHTVKRRRLQHSAGTLNAVLHQAVGEGLLPRAQRPVQCSDRNAERFRDALGAEIGLGAATGQGLIDARAQVQAHWPLRALAVQRQGQQRTQVVCNKAGR